MTSFAQAVADAGGFDAPPEAAARLRALLADELVRGRKELGEKRSGYGHPIAVAIASTMGGDAPGLVAVAPAPAALRSDPDAAPDRAWLLVAALAGALVEGSGLPAPARARDLALQAGSFAGEHLALFLPGAPGTEPDPELAALAFDEAAASVDRLRAQATALPERVIGTPDDLRPAIGDHHPLKVAEVVARLGGRPADQQGQEGLEDQVLQVLGQRTDGTRPHDDPDPARRVARRILQRLDGMGKWGGYHTDFAHLARGFAGNDRHLADAVGEALLQAGLLSEKPSVGQRHVFLNPRRAGDIHRFIDDGTSPAKLRLPQT